MEKTKSAACSQSECDGCEIQGKLLCVHKPKDLIDFYVLFNLSCPINRVPDDVRESFFRNYPEFGNAWGKRNPAKSHTG